MSRTVDFGVIRMLQGLVDDRRVDWPWRVFHDIEEARTWLRERDSS